MQSDGFYIANFEYKNDNEEYVYIPIGDDNLLEGNNIIWIESEEGDHQPTLFKPGGGYFSVKFDGDWLSYTVNSLDEDHKVSSAANANSSSTKCQTTKSAAVTTGQPEEDLLQLDDLMVYPNPVTDKVNLRMKDIEKYKMLMLLDVTGRAHPITSIKTRSDRLEIDMSHLAAGPYFFRVIMEDTTRVIPVIKN